MNNKQVETIVKPFIYNDAIEWEEVAPGVKRKIMSYNDSLMLVKVAFEKNAVGSVHQHYHTQISYVASGVFEIEIDGQKQLLKQGDVFHAEPHVFHGAVCIEAGELIDVFNPHREDFVQS
jgi:quercetin dioxygenase-like cupin family protein